MEHILGSLLDADKILQAKERTQRFTRYVVRGIVNDMALNAILGSF